MRTIWKSVLPVNVMTVAATNSIAVQEGARFLTLREQGNDISLWFEVDPEAPRGRRRYQIFPTGSEADIREGLEYRGTAFFKDVGVLHVYEVMS